MQKSIFNVKFQEIANIFAFEQNYEIAIDC